MDREGIQVRRLAITLGVAMLAVAVLTPLLVVIWGREPSPDSATKLNELSTVLRPLVDGDRLAIGGPQSKNWDSLARSEVFRFGRSHDGERLRDLKRWIEAQRPGEEIEFSGGRWRQKSAGKPVALVSDPANQGFIGWQEPAHDVFAETRRVRKIAQYTLSVFLLLALFLTAPSGRRLEEAGLQASGPGRSSNLRTWWQSAWLGFVSLGIYIVLLTLLGERELQFRGVTKAVLDILQYGVATPVVNILQDLLFFGFLFRVLGNRPAITALVFGFGHYLKIDKDHRYEGPDWSLGLDSLRHLVDGVPEMLVAPQAALGICLVGWVLADLRKRSGSVWMTMGLHAGWFVARGAGRRSTRDVEGSHEWLFGSNAFHDGLLGCVVMAGAWWFLSRQSGRKSLIDKGSRRENS